MSALFELAYGGISVMADPDDNPRNHDVQSREGGTRISFEIVNVCDADWNGRVGIELNDIFVTERSSQPRQNEVAYVSLGRLGSDEHTALAYVNPGLRRMRSPYQHVHVELPLAINTTIYQS